MKTATLVSEDVKSENYRLFVVINFISYVGFFAHLFFIPLFFWIDLYVMAYFNFFSVISWGAAYYLNRKGRHVESVILLSIEVIAHASLATYYLGWDSGFHYYFIPFILFLFINHKQTILVIGLEVTVIFFFYLWLQLTTNGIDYQSSVPVEIIEGFQFMNIAINFLAIGMLGYGLRTSSMRAEKEMEQLATTDSLTGLYNRRKMYEMILLEQKRLQRSTKHFVLVMADLDLFKTINDQYGHACGDYALKEVTLLMKKTLREQDVLSRWGGEEFILLLPETDIIGANKVVEVLRKEIAGYKFQCHSKSFSTTMTFGMVLFDGSQSVEMVLKHADELLYKGKEKGRNCIMIN
ncbi:MAG: GGDEF domain-containing protein [Gammaproteobacteria bacterium]|nr:GGDEF domain-containing protein [Gammaproteobacteria bacterium]